MEPFSPDFLFCELLGRGTEGQVYRAIHRGSRRVLAVKVSASPGTIEPPARDIPAHPHLLPTLARFQAADGRVCSVVPFVEKLDPRPRVRSAGPSAALDLLAQAAAALSSLHRAGLVHGDLKPENLLVQEPSVRRNDSLWLVVSDVGGVKRVESHAQALATGTVGYMAPEVLDGNPINPASDVFSLGVWFLWLITGSDPTPGTEFSSVLSDASRLAARALPWRFDERFAGYFWQELLEKLLARSPEERFQDGASLLRFLAAQGDIASPGLEVKLPGVIWNPLVLLSEEARLIGPVAESLSDGAGGGLTIVTVNRREGAHLVLKGVCRRLSILEDDLTFLSPETAGEEGPSITKDRPGNWLIIDSTEPRGQTDPCAFDTIISHLLSAHPPGAGRSRTIIVLQTRRLPVRIPELDPAVKRQLRVREFEAEWRSSTNYHAWTEDLFSGIPLVEDVRTSLAEIGGATPDIMFRAIEAGLRSDIWRTSSAGITLDAHGGAAWLDGLLTERSRCVAELSEAAGSLWRFLNRFPSGLRPALVTSLSVSWPEMGQAIVELWEAGLVRETEDQALHLVAPDIRNDSAIGKGVSPGMVNAITALLSTSGQPDSLTNLERVELELIVGSEWSRLQGRAIACARRLAHQKRPTPALMILNSLQEAPAESLRPASRARVEELRARSLNALGLGLESTAALVRSVSCWEESGHALLAGASGVQAAVWVSAVEGADRGLEFLERVRRTLAGLGGVVPRRLLARADSQRAVLLQRGPEAGGVPEICRQVLENPDSDDLARMEAHRLLGFAANSERRLVEGRRHLAAALRLAHRHQHPDVDARVLITTGVHELSRGHARKSHYLMRWMARLDASRIRPTEKYAWLSGRGGVAFESGDLREALRCNQEALATGERLGNLLMKRNATRNLGLIMFRMNRPGPALGYLREIYEPDRPAPPSDFHPAFTIGEVLLELGDVSEAGRMIREAASDPGWLEAPIRRGVLLVGESRLALAENDTGLARSMSEEAMRVFGEIGAVDEEAKEELRRLELPGGEVSRGEIESRLASVDQQAARLHAWQIAMSARLVRARLCRWLGGGERRAILDALDGELARSGYALLELPALQLRAEILIGEKRLLEAQDVLRTAIERIRHVAGELGDRRLRSCYLSDPRRRRFLELIRECRPSP